MMGISITLLVRVRVLISIFFIFLVNALALEHKFNIELFLYYASPLHNRFFGIHCGEVGLAAMETDV